LRFRTQKHSVEPTFHSFVLTKEDGHRTYGFSLVFYEECRNRKICAAMQTLQAMHITELSSGQNGTPPTYVVCFPYNCVFDFLYLSASLYAKCTKIDDSLSVKFLDNLGILAFLSNFYRSKVYLYEIDWKNSELDKLKIIIYNMDNLKNIEMHKTRVCLAYIIKFLKLPCFVPLFWSSWNIFRDFSVRERVRMDITRDRCHVTLNYQPIHLVLR